MTDIEKELRLASRTSPLVVLGQAADEIKRLREQNVIAAEREACAQFVEETFTGAQPIADAIRARKT